MAQEGHQCKQVLRVFKGLNKKPIGNERMDGWSLRTRRCKWQDLDKHISFLYETMMRANYQIILCAYIVFYVPFPCVVLQEAWEAAPGCKTVVYLGHVGG
ncbi:hypothetical protein SLE2022_158320 [Rubroshorea leprosula]